LFADRAIGLRGGGGKVGEWGVGGGAQYLGRVSRAIPSILEKEASWSASL